MILSSQEIGRVSAVRDFLHGLLVVGKIFEIIGQFLHAFGIAGHGVHNVLNQLCIICTTGCTDPGSAPVITGRSVTDRIISKNTIAGFLLAALFPGHFLKE